MQASFVVICLIYTFEISANYYLIVIFAFVFSLTMLSTEHGTNLDPGGNQKFSITDQNQFNQINQTGQKMLSQAEGKFLLFHQFLPDA